ncbi:hypothetical protein RQP46_002302 [Phenoliferia psychrophenolica]
MASTFQLWLSPRPTRTVYPVDKPLLTAGGACTTWFTEENGIHYIYADHDVSMKGCQGGPNATSTPPLHIHLGQDEFFKVERGKLAATMGGEPVFLTPADGEYRAVKGQAHRFWSVESEGNMLVRMRVSPEGKVGFDEQFYRNTWGYLNDCERSGKSPSPFQMSLFLYHWDMILATPLPVAVAKALHHIMGYQTSYEEYWPTTKKDL